MIGPWDLKRGTQTVLQPSNRDGVEAEQDEDEKAVLQYAKEHPDEEKGEVIAVPPKEFQAVDIKPPEMSDAEMEQMIPEAEKRDREFDLALTVASKQRLADPEGVKRSQASQPPGQAKFVKFDHTETEEKKAKQSRTSGMFSPAFAGDLVSSPSASASSPPAATGHGGRNFLMKLNFMMNMNLKKKPLWKHGIGMSTTGCWRATLQIMRSAVRTRAGLDFSMRTLGLQKLMDKQAMYAELERLRQLEVTSGVQAEVDVSEAMRSDTKLVRDWRFRQGCWTRPEWWPENSEVKVHLQMKRLVPQLRWFW